MAKNRHRSIRLSVDATVLREVSGTEGDLVQAVLLRAEEYDFDTVQDLGCALVKEWEATVETENQDSPPMGPPVLPVLAIYVLAVNHGSTEGYSAHAYYERLHDLLQCPTHRISSLQRSTRLWEALERWSKHLVGGKLGVFETSIVGQQAYVGIPRRQILLSLGERAPLRRAFLRDGLRPGSIASNGELHRSAKDAAGLLTRTRRLLERWPRDPASRELLAEIRAEFTAWEDISPDDLSDATDRHVRLRFSLGVDGARVTKIWLEADRIEQLTDSEQDIELTGPVRPGASIRGLHTSTRDGQLGPVIVDEDGDREWIDEVGLFDAIEMRISHSGTILRREASRYLIFRRGSRDRVLEEVGVRSLLPGELFLLVAPAALDDGVHPDFVASFKGAWKRLPLRQDASFRPFVAAGEETEQVPPRVRLRGGIRSAHGTKEFLAFALPSVVVQSSDTDDRVVRVSCFNERGDLISGPLSMPEQTSKDGCEELLGTSTMYRERIFSFPALSTQVVYAEVEVRLGDENVSTIGLYVERATSAPPLEVRPFARDAFGRRCASDEQGTTQGIDVLSEWQGPEPALSSPARPADLPAVENRPLPAMHLTQLMRARGRVSWSDAKIWLPQCVPFDSPSPQSDLALQVQALHSLGVLELEEGGYGGLKALVALPPRLALLPRSVNLGFSPGTGLELGHVAIPVGCWTADEQDRLSKAARGRGVELKVVVRDKGLALFPFKPLLLSRGVQSIGRLSLVADDVGVEFDSRVPLACQLADELPPIEDLKSAAGWEPGSISAERNTRYFDPVAVGVTRERPDGRYLCAESRDPDRPIWEHFLIDRELNQRLPLADRQLGRWFVRTRAFPETPLPGSSSSVFVPFELRFPRALERAMVLSSGTAPSVARYDPGASPFSSAAVSRAFAIPAPPQKPVDCSISKPYCTGNFIVYADIYETAAWSRGNSIPMLGLRQQAARLPQTGR